MSFATAEADRRIGNLIQIGRVTAVNGDGTARVKIGDLDTRPLPVGALRAGGMQVWWMPTVGEQVVVLAPSGDMARGVVLCSIHAGNEPSADPTTPMIDLRGGEMVLRGDLRIEGKLHITEDTTSDADVIASGISLVTHVHGGILPGGGTTGTPS